ncbi:MAG: hypothetical protein IKQ10_10110 [Oscillospiraceae bacterium]|nr:hypothetical protein [Oscillospiraceae bacterium]
MKGDKKRKSRKKPVWPLLTVLALLLAAAVGAAVFLMRNAVLDGHVVSTDTEVLDLRGADSVDIDDLKRLDKLRYLDLRGIDLTAAELAELRGALPACEILCDVALGGERCDIRTTELRFADLPADWENIALLTDLRSLTVEQCTDPAAMITLSEALPDCEMRWNLGLGGGWYDAGSEELEIPGDSVYFEELLVQLQWFPALRSVRLPGAVLSPDQQRTLLSSYPGVDFYWSVAVGELRVASDASELSFAPGESVTVDAIESALDLLGALKTVDFTNSGVSADDRIAFRDSHEELDVRWSVALRDNFYGCDTRLLEFNDIYFTPEDLEELEAALPYLPELEQLELCDTGLSNETLDALNKKYEGINVVWKVRFGWNNFYTLRTDATYFRPSEFGVTPPDVSDADAKILSYCRNMEALDLGHQVLLTNLEFLRDMPHIKYLIIAECSIADISPLASLKELKYLEMFSTNVSDLTPLLKCTELRALNMCYIKALQDGAWKVLKKMTWLEWLWYCNCPLSAEQMRELTNRENLTTFFLRGGECSGGTWRYSPYYYEMRDAFHAIYMPGGTNGVDPENQSTQIIVDDAGQWFYLENFDMDQYWWKQERYSMYHPYLIGLTV